jgi:NAD-dependent DNA ligase
MTNRGAIFVDSKPEKTFNQFSSNTDCVVVGADADSKADKAKQLGIKTLNEAAFK